MQINLNTFMKYKFLTFSVLGLVVSTVAIPYYIMSSSWFGTQVGPPIIASGFGVFLLILELGMLVCIMLDMPIIPPVLALIPIIGSLTYGGKALSYSGVIKIGAWFVLLAGIAVIVFGLISSNTRYNMLNNGVLDFSGVMKAFNIKIVNQTTQQYQQPTQTVDKPIWVCNVCGAKNKGSVCGRCGAARS